MISKEGKKDGQNGERDNGKNLQWNGEVRRMVNI